MKRMNRLFEIIYILMRKNTVTAQEFAERFEVSRRTIYRDIDALSLAGIPVYTVKGKGGGISLMEDFVLNKSILSEQEQGEILTALQGLSAVQGGDAESVLEKLSSLFQKDTVNWLEVDFTDWSFQNGDLFEKLKTAILQRRIVEFTYYSTYAEKLHRRIEPMQLWFKHRAWYVRGFCLSRQETRLFKLVRMKNLVLTEEIFPQRNLLAQAESGMPNPAHTRQDVTVKLRIFPEMSYRVFDDFPESQVERREDGSFVATATWPEDEWLYGFLLSFGEYFQVLEPAGVREKLQGKIKKILKNHEI